MNKKGFLTCLFFSLTFQSCMASFIESPFPVIYKVFHPNIQVPLYGDFTPKGQYVSLNTLVVHPVFFSSKTSLSSSNPIILDKLQAATEVEEQKDLPFQGDHIGILLEAWGYDLEDSPTLFRKHITPLDPKQGLHFKFSKPIQPRRIEIFIKTKANNDLESKLKITTQEEELIETETKTVKIFHTIDALPIKKTAKEYEEEWVAKALS